jgi:type I restriction enzyme R subunit
VPKENEPLARIKINRLLEEAGWRFEDSKDGPANISLEAGVKYKDLGDDFENAVTIDGRRGSVDFLLLDKDKKPLVVVEAKRQEIMRKIVVPDL